MTDALRLREILTIERGSTYKSALVGQPGPVLLGLASIERNGGFRRDSLRTYGGDSPARMLVRPGQLYASLKDVTQSADLLGSVARVPVDSPAGRLTQDTVRLDLISDVVTAEYVYWCLRSPQYRTYCRAHSTGTTNLGLPRDDFLNFEIPKPTSWRLTLVDVIETHDELIEVNRRIAQDCTSLWRATVRDALVDARESRPLSELADFVNGRNFTKGASGHGRPVIRTPEVRRGPVPGTARNDVEVPDEYVAREGDVLFVWSGSLGVGRWMWEEGLVNQHVFKVVPKADTPAWLVFSLIEHQLPWFLSLAADKATTMGHIKREHLNAGVPVPSAAEIQRLGKIIEPLWEEALQCGIAMHELRRTRDELLPLLMSGRLGAEDVAA